MKIIAIIGSPRGKGAGYQVVKKIEDGMKALGGVEFECLFLKDANLKPCLGCYRCMAFGEDKCPLKDDRAAIEQRLLAADGIILSSPVYVNNVSALMKNFIDRFAYAMHRPRFHRQKVMTVVNMGGTERKETQAALRYALGGRQLVLELAIATPPWLQTRRAVDAKERNITAAAGKFYHACRNTSLATPSFKSFMDFYIFQELSRECQEALPADYGFYHGRDYYYETKASLLKAALARAVVGIMMFVYRKQGLGLGSVRWPATKGPAQPASGQ